MKYNITYLISVHPEPAGLEKHEVPPGCGAAQGIIVVSIVWGDDGSHNVKFTSKDGRTNLDLAPEEWWRVWCGMAAFLRDVKGLDHDKREFCDTVFGVIQERYIEGGRPSDDGSSGESESDNEKGPKILLN